MSGGKKDKESSKGVASQSTAGFSQQEVIQFIKTAIKEQIQKHINKLIDDKFKVQISESYELDQLEKLKKKQESHTDGKHEYKLKQISKQILDTKKELEGRKDKKIILQQFLKDNQAEKERSHESLDSGIEGLINWFTIYVQREIIKEQSSTSTPTVDKEAIKEENRISINSYGHVKYWLNTVLTDKKLVRTTMVSSALEPFKQDVLTNEFKKSLKEEMKRLGYVLGSISENDVKNCKVGPISFMDMMDVDGLVVDAVEQAAAVKRDKKEKGVANPPKLHSEHKVGGKNKKKGKVEEASSSNTNLEQQQQKDSKFDEIQQKIESIKAQIPVDDEKIVAIVIDFAERVAFLKKQDEEDEGLDVINLDKTIDFLRMIDEKLQQTVGAEKVEIGNVVSEMQYGLGEINHDLDKRDVILAINNAVEIFNQQLDDPEDLDERLPAYNVNFNNISDYDLETILVDIFNKVEKRKDVLSPLSLPPNVTLAFSNLSEKFSEYKNYKTREEIEDREKRLFKQIVTEKIISEILDMKKESKLQLLVEKAKEKVGEIVNPFIQGFGKDGQTVKEKQDQIASLAEKVFTLACIGFHGEIGFKLVDVYVKSVNDTINKIQIVGGKIVPDAQRQQAKALEEKYCSMLFDALHEKFKQSKMLNDSQMDRSWFNNTDKVGGNRRKLQALFDGVAMYLGPPQQSDQVANCFAQATNRLGGVAELLKLFNGDSEPAPDRTLADREKKRPYIYKEDLEELWKPRLIDTDVTEFNIIKVLHEYRLGVLKEIHNEEFNMLSGRMEEQNPSEETKLDILALTELDKKLLLEIARKQKIEDDKEKAQLQFKLQAKQLFKDEVSKRRSIEGEEELGYEELEKIQDKLILMQVAHERARQELDEKEQNARTNVTEEEELLRHDIQRELDKIKGEQLNEQQKVDKLVNEVVSIVQQANSIRDNKSTDLKKVVHMLNLLSNDLPHRISNLFYK